VRQLAALALSTARDTEFPAAVADVDVSHGLAAVLGRFAEADLYFSQSASMCESDRARFFGVWTNVSWGAMLA
jgi:hypothetical protein